MDNRPYNHDISNFRAEMLDLLDKLWPNDKEVQHNYEILKEIEDRLLEMMGKY